ncbi:hypothetical protein [Saccharothrix longispora]|nr:hypothetical protein [Saccharothrix longispora]MDU0287728.1 hypothetical protein [Saccharothrix longispora]
MAKLLVDDFSTKGKAIHQEPCVLVRPSALAGSGSTWLWGT